MSLNTVWQEYKRETEAEQILTREIEAGILESQPTKKMLDKQEVQPKRRSINRMNKQQ